MFKVINKEHQMKNIINKCMNELIDDPMDDVNVEIVILSKPISYLKYFYMRNFFSNVIGMICGDNRVGFSCEHYDRVFILGYRYDINHSDKMVADIEKMRMLETTFHEIRHQYQRQKCPYFYKLGNVNIITRRCEYSATNTGEFDADVYASNMMINHLDRIREIIEEDGVMNGYCIRTRVVSMLY